MKRTLTLLLGLLVLTVLAIPAFHSVFAKPVPPAHPEYHDAINDLRNARKHLEKALDDGYGHRDRAMRAIDGAIKECEEAAQVLH